MFSQLEKAEKAEVEIGVLCSFPALLKHITDWLIGIESDIDWRLFIISFPSSTYKETVGTIFAAKTPRNTFDICSNAVSTLIHVTQISTPSLPFAIYSIITFPKICSQKGRVEIWFDAFSHVITSSIYHWHSFCTVKVPQAWLMVLYFEQRIK